MSASLEVIRHTGIEASVNAWIITNGREMLLVDALRNSAEATELANRLAARDEQLIGVFVTHGHPDHFLGLGALRTRFPDAPFYVASDAIQQDVQAFAAWMTDVGWLDGEPHMKPRSAANAGGFNYLSELRVLSALTFSFPSGGTLEIDAAYLPTESAHISTLWLPEEGIFLSSDLVYEGVHAWEGAGVEREHIHNWVTTCGELRTRFAKLEHDVTICPGHGAAGGLERFANMRTYLLDFLTVVDAASTRSEAAETMCRLYPRYQQADFLLALSIENHVPEAA